MQSIESQVKNKAAVFATALPAKMKDAEWEPGFFFCSEDHRRLANMISQEIRVWVNEYMCTIGKNLAWAESQSKLKAEVRKRIDRPRSPSLSVE